jgi:hypothetical protein
VQDGDVNGAGGGSMDDGALSSAREEVLLEATLRHQVGIDPFRVGPVLDLAAVGIVNSAWRNSPVEDWHAGDGPLTDGAMLRVNAHTTWRVREIVRRWRSDIRVAPGESARVLDDLDTDAVDQLAVRIWRWLVRPSRRLPIGLTLAELAATGLEEYVDHADGAMGSFAAMAEERGARHAMWRSAAHAGLACRSWWGTPGWPRLVTTFLAVLDDLEHEHWRTAGSDRVRPVEPAQVIDRAELRQVLLRRPWDLDADAAEWVVGMGIGYLRPPVPPLPDAS